MIKRVIRKVKAYKKTYGLKETIKWFWVCVQYKLRMKKAIITEDFYFDRIEDEYKPFLTTKEKPNVVLCASIPYYDIGGGQRCSQLAKTFNKMGFNVIYVYAFKSSESKIYNLPMPMQTHLYIDYDTVDSIRDRITENDLFIFESPSVRFEGLLELALEKKCRIAYENIDNWETSLGSTVYNEDMLVRLLKASHVLIGTAKPLASQLEEYLVRYNIEKKPVLYLANAVDDELFCGLKKLDMPEDLVQGKETLLYYGSLWGEWFDWDMIIGLAKKHPDYAINLIGDYAPIPHIVEKCPKNIHFLGLKMQSELPAYLAHIDYSLVPFKPGEISDYVSPLKIFEYIAMYSKVLCTDLPDIQGYPNVYCGNTMEEWDKIIDEHHEVSREAADDFIISNSWQSRISEILNVVYPEMSKSILKDKLSVVILNYNNMNVIFKCVNTLLKFNEIYNYEIIVVDNGSKDGSYELLGERYKNGEIKLVQNEKNGCSSGRNLGVANATREYIMFLDSDQWITSKYWLRPYEEIMRKCTDWGLIGWAAGFFNNEGRAYHVVDSFPYRYMPCSCLTRYDIGYLGSGGMIVRHSDFDAVDGFDLFYDPTCYEDTDFSLKIRNTGKQIYYCPYLGIIHLPHQTTKSGSAEHAKLTQMKQEYFTKKWKAENPQLLKFIK